MSVLNDFTLFGFISFLFTLNVFLNGNEDDDEHDDDEHEKKTLQKDVQSKYDDYEDGTHYRWDQPIVSIGNNFRKDIKDGIFYVFHGESYNPKKDFTFMRKSEVEIFESYNMNVDSEIKSFEMKDLKSPALAFCVFKKHDAIYLINLWYNPLEIFREKDSIEYEGWESGLAKKKVLKVNFNESLSFEIRRKVPTFSSSNGKIKVKLFFEIRREHI